MIFYHPEQPTDVCGTCGHARAPHTHLHNQSYCSTCACRAFVYYERAPLRFENLRRRKSR